MLIEIIFALLLTSIGIGAIIPIFERSIHFNPKNTKSSIVNLECETIQERKSYILKKCKDKNSEKVTLVIVKQDLGFGILELVLSISFGLIMLTALSRTYAIVSFHYKTQEEWIREDQAASRVKSEISRLFKVSDTHPLDLAPKLHSDGKILLKSGSPNEVMYGNSKFQPSPASSAFTNSKLEIGLLSEISTCTASGNYRYGTACLRYLKSASTTDFQSFILISLDGIYEAQGQFNGKAQCKAFTLTLGESMLFNNPLDKSSCNERLLIPINFIQTIYQSKSGDFRLISHRTDSNVENQPLTLPLNNLALSLSLEPFYKSWRIDLKVKSKNKLLSNKQIYSLIARQSGENLMFNRL